MADLSKLTIRSAIFPADLEPTRILLREYAAHLAATSAKICVPNFEQELAALPGSYAPPSGLILLAELNDRLAGCVAFHPVASIIAQEKACEMKRLWVDPAARGHQLGRQLVEAGMAWARSIGYAAVYLDTVPAAMPHANALYARLGFGAVSRYNNNPVPGVVFFRRGIDDPQPGCSSRS